MNDETENLVLRALRRIEISNDSIREDLREVKTRLSLLEQQNAVMGQQIAALSGRMDRFELRLERIVKRLDLVEA